MQNNLNLIALSLKPIHGNRRQRCILLIDHHKTRMRHPLLRTPADILVLAAGTKVLLARGELGGQALQLQFQVQFIQLLIDQSRLRQQLQDCQIRLQDIG